MTKSRVKGDIYEVTCRGQYYALMDGKKGIKHYELTFKADDNAKKKGFLSTFRNALTPRNGEDGVVLKMMKAKYPDYKRFRTHDLEVVKCISDPNKQIKELNLMNRAQIVRLIDHKGYPIDCDLYPGAGDLRQAIRDWAESPDAFQKAQAKRMESRGPDLMVSAALDELNKTDEARDQEEQDIAKIGLSFESVEDDEFYVPEIHDKQNLDELVYGI